MAEPLYRARAMSGLWTQRNPLREGRPDALLDGLNVELTNRMTYARAPGSTAYSTEQMPAAVKSFYGFRKFADDEESIELIADTASAVYSLTTTSKTTVFTKSANASASSFLSVGNTLYIGDKVETKAYQNNASRNWGIAIDSSTASSPAYAGTAADSGGGSGLGSVGPSITGTGANGGGGSGSSPSWASPGNITVDDAAVAGWSTPDETSDSEYINATNFGFAVPAGATILGISAEFKIRSGPGNNGQEGSVLIIKGGSRTGTDHASGDYIVNPDFAWKPHGGAADLWGTTFTVAEINASNFGVAWQGHGDDGVSVVEMAAVRITVFFTMPVSWTNPTNAQGAPNASYATMSTISDLASSNRINLTNYGFAVTGTIGGIKLVLTAKSSTAVDYYNVYAQLLKAGVPIGDIKSSQVSSTSDTTIRFGATGEIWNGSFTAAEINASTFGVSVWVTHPVGSGDDIFSLDSGQLTIYTSAAPAIAVSASVGTFSATAGYRYRFAYGNSKSGHVSNASVASLSTGIFTNKLDVEVGVVASTDPQVDQIWLLRTADGGSTYLSVPANPYPNTTATLHDNAADSTLNILQLAAVNLENTIPPTGLIALAYHMDRIWGGVGNAVYYASGPDLGNIMGNGNEGFPPANTFTFPSAVTRLVPMSIGLLVITVSDFYIIRGNGSAVAATAIAGITPFYSSPFIKGIGLLHYHAMDVNGTVIYMHATDGQLLSLEPSSGVSEIGFPIGTVPSGFTLNSIDTLDDFDPATSFVSWHVAGSGDKALYVSDGSTGWFRLDPSRAPDGWSPKRELTDGCSAVQSIETSPGVRQLLIGPASSGDVLYRDLSLFADNGEDYPAYMRLGSIVITQPGQLARLAFLAADFAAVGTQPLVSVSLDELNATVFDDITVNREVESPFLYAQGPGPATIYANRYNFTTDLNRPAWCRHLQVVISFGNDTVQNELLGLSIFGGGYQTQ